RRLVALGAAAVLSGALALGPATPLSRLFYRLPVYGQFRSWARYVVVVDLAVAVFAAYGVRRLRRGGAAERRWATVAAAGAAGVVALAAVAVPRLSAVARNLPAGGVRPAAVGLPLAAAVAGALGAVALGRRWRGWPTVVVAVLVLDACSFGFFYEWRDGTGPARAVAEAHNSRQTFWGGVDDRPGGLDRYLFVGADVAPMGADFVNATDYKGLRSANGSGPLAPADYLQALGMSAFGGIVTPDRVWRPNGRALDLLRVTTVLVDRPSARGGPPADSLLQRGTPVPGSTLLRFDHTPALPEAFLVGRAEVRSRPAVLDALGSVRRPAWNANSATFEVAAARPALLVVSQAWLPGWSARVGGHRVPSVRVDGVVQGYPLPAGRQEVTIAYHAPGARPGLVVSLLTLAGLLAWIAADRRRPVRPVGGVQAVVDDVTVGHRQPVEPNGS